MLVTNNVIGVQNNYENRIKKAKSVSLPFSYKFANFNNEKADSFELSFSGGEQIIGKKFAQELIDFRKVTYETFLDFIRRTPKKKEIFPSNKYEKIVYEICTQHDSKGNYFVSDDSIKKLCNLNENVLNIVNKIYQKFDPKKIDKVIGLANKCLNHGYENNLSFLGDIDKYMRGYFTDAAKFDDRIKWHKDNYRFLEELISTKDAKNEDFYTLEQIDKLMANKNGQKIHEILTAKAPDGKCKYYFDSSDKNAFINSYNQYAPEIDKSMKFDRSILSTLMELAKIFKENDVACDYIMQTAPNIFYDKNFYRCIDNENYVNLVKTFKRAGKENDFSKSDVKDELALYSDNAQAMDYYRTLKNKSGELAFPIKDKWDGYDSHSYYLLRFLVGRYGVHTENAKELIKYLAEHGYEPKDLLNWRNDREPVWWLAGLIEVNNKNPQRVKELFGVMPIDGIQSIATTDITVEQLKAFNDMIKKSGRKLDDYSKFAIPYAKDPEFTDKIINAKTLDGKEYRLKFLNFSWASNIDNLIEARKVDANFVDRILEKRTDHNEYFFPLRESDDLLKVTKAYQNPKYKSGIDYYLNQNMSIYNISQEIEKWTPAQ